MTLSENQKLYIRDAFKEMKSKEDFLQLLNYVKPLLYGKDLFHFTISHINYHFNPNVFGRYTKFKINKKSGGERVIYSPSSGLKSIQKCLNLIFQTIYDVNPAATGFVPNKSIVDNAKIHAGNIYVYNIDLKDFFSSIDQARIWGRLQHPPFNLNKKTNKLELANLIASLCCHSIDVERMDENGDWQSVKRNVLPQGAPTSPTLVNIICQQLDFYLTAVAKRFGLKYTRYADDITFSSMHNVYQKDGDFLRELHRIIGTQNFHIKETKTRLQKQGYTQEVTGITVNVTPNVKKRYIKQLRMWLYLLEKNGHETTNIIFASKYIEDKGHIKSNAPDILIVLLGKLNFLKMVKGVENSTYKKLFQRYMLLSQKNKSYDIIKIDSDTEVNHNPLETVKLLKLFKYDNKYSFKQLVHKPLDEDDFDFIEILNSANKQLLELSKGNNNKLNIPKNPIDGIQSLLQTLRTVGVNFYQSTGLHPLDDKKVGNEIQTFKGKYRFGNEKSESSILSDLIERSALKKTFSNHIHGVDYSFGSSDNSGLFNSEQIIFYPNLQKFQSKANFFTWVPNITIALSIVFDSILKHSNIEGNRNFDPKEKKIIINIERHSINDLVKIDLSILDMNSLLIGDNDNILKDMRRDFFSILVGICDFKVQYKDVNGENHECKVLPYADKVKSIDEDPQGFKYIFTFYD